jgi:C4-dicarboxylate-binding protein DctP
VRQGRIGETKESKEKEDAMKRTSLKKIAFMASIFAALAMILGSVDAMAAQRIVIKLTTVQLPQQQMGKGSAQLAKMVKGQLGDKVDMKVYPAAQLYSGDEEMTALSRGEIQMAFAISSKLETLGPEFQAWKLPYMFPNAEIAYKVLESDAVQSLRDKLTQKNFRMLGIVDSGNVLVSNSKHPITKPEDFKGIKMRSFGRMGKDTLEMLGAQAVVTASEETYSALQQGVIDGMSVPNSVFLARKYYTVQKYVTDMGIMQFTSVVLLTNPNFWNNLPADVRTKLTAIINKVIGDMRAEMATENPKILKEIAGKGCQTVQLTPAQEAVFKKALAGVSTKYGPEIGLDLIARIEKKIAELTK